MDAKRYLDEIVDPCVQRMVDDPSDRSLIFQAATATYHAADWIARELDSSLDIDRQRKTLNKVRQRITARFPDFEILRAAANTHKHKTLTQTRFKGLTNPLTSGGIAPFHLDGSLLLIDGKPLIGETLPEYVLIDGTRKKTVPLIRGALQAIRDEFEL